MLAWMDRVRVVSETQVMLFAEFLILLLNRFAAAQKIILFLSILNASYDISVNLAVSSHKSRRKQFFDCDRLIRSITAFCYGDLNMLLGLNELP